MNNPSLTQPDSPANDISPQSTDVITDAATGRPNPNGVNLHATWVSDTAAGEFNSFAPLGVAYQATILSVRADDAGTCGFNPTGSGCTFTDDNQALAINYIDNSHAPLARIVNISLGGPGALDSNFETALSNAVADGIVFTIAAGNDGPAEKGDSSVEFPAAYAVDPRYVGSVLAVGSVSCSGPQTASNCSNLANVSISSFSAVADNGTEDVRAGFLVAPGDNIIANCDPNAGCQVVSGTSFSAPTVAGALALLLQAFPTLTGKDAIKLLEQTANHSGNFSNSMIYGFGLIDLKAAFQQKGPLSVETAAGGIVTPGAAAGSSISTPFGDSVVRSNALKTVGYDSFQRPFIVNMAQGFHVGPRRSLQSEIGVAQNTAQVVFADGENRLSLTTNARPDPELDRLALRGRYDIRTADDRRADVNLEADFGALSFQGWTGQSGMSPAPGLGAGENAYALLAQPDHAIRAAYRLSPSLSFSAEAGGGSPYSLYGFNDLAPSRYDMASARLSKGPLSLTLSAGQLLEPEGPLGSFLPRGSTYALPAQTGFTTARIDWAATSRLVLSAEAGTGRTRAEGVILGLGKGAVSSQWLLAAHTLCPAEQAGCLRFDAEVGQPARIEGGTFVASLAEIPTVDSQIIQFTPRRFSASPSGRELDLGFGLARDFTGWGELEFRGLGILDENNQADIPPNLGVLASWRTRF